MTVGKEPRRRSGKKPAEARSYDTEFPLKPRERSTYGATITARDEDSGRTRTFALTNMTMVEATRAIIDELDLLSGDWRIVSIATPVSIERDLYANRITLSGKRPGAVGQTPEALLLGKLRRKDLLPSQSWKIGAYAGPVAP